MSGFGSSMRPKRMVTRPLTVSAESASAGRPIIQAGIAGYKWSPGPADYKPLVDKIGSGADTGTDKIAPKYTMRPHLDVVPASMGPPHAPETYGPGPQAEQFLRFPSLKQGKVTGSSGMARQLVPQDTKDGSWQPALGVVHSISYTEPRTQGDHKLMSFQGAMGIYGRGVFGRPCTAVDAPGPGTYHPEWMGPYKDAKVGRCKLTLA